MAKLNSFLSLNTVLSLSSGFLKRVIEQFLIDDENRE